MIRVLAALLALSLLPVAAASGAGLSLEGPDALVHAQGETRVPLRVHVVLADAVCSQDEELRVRLAAYGPSDAQAQVPAEVVVRVPAGGYVGRPFEADADALLVLAPAAGTQGQVMVAAGYDLPSSCVTSGDPSAEASLGVRYVAGDAPAPEPAPPAPDATASAEPPARHGAPGLLAIALGGGVVATLFFVVGRLGERRGRDGLP